VYLSGHARSFTAELLGITTSIREIQTPSFVSLNGPARYFTAELSGIFMSIGEYQRDTIAFVCVSQRVISFFSPREFLVRPRSVGRYNHLRSCLSMDKLVRSPLKFPILPRLAGRYNRLRSRISMARYRVSILEAADTTSY
jgi:hypothetical protein